MLVRDGCSAKERQDHLIKDEMDMHSSVEFSDLPDRPYLALEVWRVPGKAAAEPSRLWQIGSRYD